ncbi:MAG TPA: protein translocase subunit SecF [Candidatus Dormibacteraeota bacterium]|nr:protein translocase subunit SecF [Candidatus Dormibacteraeota bacterium]
MSELSDVSSEEQVADLVQEAKAQQAEVVAATPEPRPPRRLNIIGRRNLFFAISLVVIIPGIVSMWHNHFLLGIDFAGGTELTVSFANHPSLAQVQRVVDAENANGSVIETGSGYIIRYPVLNTQQLANIQSDLKNHLGPTNVQQILSVGGTIAGETIFLSLLAVLTASAAILLLLAIRFRNVPGGWRAGFQFGGSALAALLHDVFVLTGLYSIFGTVLKWPVGEINAYFVTAVLTVVGFSVHDTIVVFDRIRENLRVSQRLSFEQVVNLSIMQTAARSIITSFTVVLVLAAIFISGGPSLQGLALALLIGIVSGTYSSIFNAAPLLVVWRRLQPLR